MLTKLYVYKPRSYKNACYKYKKIVASYYIKDTNNETDYPITNNTYKLTLIIYVFN